MRRLSTFNSDSILCLSSVCGGNTLPNVCSWCNSICSSVAGQLEHLRRELYYFYSPSHRWQIWWRWWCMLSLETRREASSLSMARKFWSELLLAAPSPLTHSHANAKALSRCNPQLCWNQKIKNVCGTFLLCINHQQLTQFGSIFFSFRVSLIRKIGRSPLSFVPMSGPQLQIETNWSQVFFLCSVCQVWYQDFFELI